MESLVAQLRPGDLVAFFYQSRTEQLSFVIPYLREGLAQNQRCLYIADNTPVALIFSKLEAAGVDVEASQERGALDVLTKHETYLRHGSFEPDKMLADLAMEVQASLAKGFTALRGSGDMGWALEKTSVLARMIEYQTKLFAEFPNSFLAVCQYDVTRFPEHIVKKMAEIHNVVIRGGQLIRKTSPKM